MISRGKPNTLSRGAASHLSCGQFMTKNAAAGPTTWLIMFMSILAVRTSMVAAKTHHKLQCGMEEGACSAQHDFDSMERAHPGFVCASCQSVANMLTEAVIRKDFESFVKTNVTMTRRIGVPFLEEMCLHHIAQAGVKLSSDGKVTPQIVTDQSVPRVHGGWIRKHLLDVCGELIVVHEKSFLEAIRNFCALDKTGKFECGFDSFSDQVCGDIAQCSKRNATEAHDKNVSAFAGLPDPSRCVPQMATLQTCIRRRRKQGNIWFPDGGDSSNLRACGVRAYVRCLAEKPALTVGNNNYTALVSARHGIFLVNVWDMYVSAALMAYGEWSDEEVQVMGLNLTPDSTVVDVGANIGAFSVPLAKRVPEGRLIAIEPQRVVSQLLSANIQLNGLPNVDVRRMVLGNSSGSFKIPEHHPQTFENFGGLAARKEQGVAGDQRKMDNHEGWDTVQSMKLDELRLAKLDLIKVDAQGMDAEVLQGGREVILQHLPDLYIEHESASRGIYDLVRSLGPYRCYFHAPLLYSTNNFRQEKLRIWSWSARSYNIYCVARPGSLVPDWLKHKDLEEIDLRHNFPCPGDFSAPSVCDPSTTRTNQT